jgi:hypothetical protein
MFMNKKTQYFSYANYLQVLMFWDSQADSKLYMEIKRTHHSQSNLNNRGRTYTNWTSRFSINPE